MSEIDTGNNNDDLEALLSRLGIKDNLDRMKQDARKDIADLIENSVNSPELREAIHLTNKDVNSKEEVTFTEDRIEIHDHTKVKAIPITRKWGLVSRKYFVIINS